MCIITEKGLRWTRTDIFLLCPSNKYIFSFQTNFFILKTSNSKWNIPQPQNHSSKQFKQRYYRRIWWPPPSFIVFKAYFYIFKYYRYRAWIFSFYTSPGNSAFSHHIDQKQLNSFSQLKFSWVVQISLTTIINAEQLDM